MKSARALLVANVLTHYRLALYEELQKRVDLRVVFFSDGGEWYWQRTEQPSGETLNDVAWLKGKWIGHTRVTPGLISEVLRTDAEVIIKDPNGKFALPATYLLARLRRKPFVFWASLWEHPKTPIHRLTRPLMRHIYRHSDAIVTYGRHVTEFVVREGGNPATTFESPQAVRQQLSPPPDLSRWNAPLEMVFVGRLEPWKGVDFLLRALDQVPARCWRLRIVGDGEQRQELERLARELQLAERVEFLGKLPNAEVDSIFREAAVVLVPSIRTPTFSEPWALVVNEAMQAGALVVASDAVGATRDGLVQDGTTGVVFRAGDVSHLATTIGALLDPAGRSRWVRAARDGQVAVRAYSHERAAAAFEHAVDVAVASRRAVTGKS